MFLSVLVLFVLFQSNVFGYIDPGTGSLLFSALFGIIGTLFFLSKALLIKLKTMSFSKNKSIETEASKKARIIIYGEDKRYCNVFKPIIEELSGISSPKPASRCRIFLQPNNYHRSSVFAKILSQVQ